MKVYKPISVQIWYVSYSGIGKMFQSEPKALAHVQKMKNAGHTPVKMVKIITKNVKPERLLEAFHNRGDAFGKIIDRVYVMNTDNGFVVTESAVKEMTPDELSKFGAGIYR